MLRIFYLFLVLQSRHLLYEANPLKGKQVRKADGQELPFVVSISLNNSMIVRKEKYAHICSGFLITRQHVVTAAHCFSSITKNYNDIVVKVGSFDLMSAESYEVKWCVTYDEWFEYETVNEYRGYNDIAIVKLVNNISSHIQLPYLTDTPDSLFSGKNALTAGWGLIENNKRPRYMRVAKVTVLCSSTCLFVAQENDLFLKYMSFKIYLCTKATPPIILGCGDSGGPLVVNDREIIGVNVGFCSLRDEPEFRKYQNKHLSVNHYRKFINEVKML